jgi:Dyp-type peroxidase family
MWRPLAVGEFVLGERDESDDVARVPEPSAIFHHGSFLVVRKLAQNRDALLRFAAAQTNVVGTGVTEFLELLLGRRRDGRLLDQPLGTPESALHEVAFSRDPEGTVCPLGAHIRRANPRDAAGFGTRLAARHRIIRRGMTYSSDSQAAPEWKDGLMFVAINARLEDQFEFIQRRWLNAGDRQRLGISHDPIAGTSRSPSAVVLQTGPLPLVTDPAPVTVRTMGGDYFFAPSIAGLRALAAWPDQPRG